LSIIKSKSEKNNISNIETYCENIDSLFDKLNGRTFDVIISAFSLYYSKDIPTLISSIKKLLSENGKFFVCGPTKGNNDELINFQSKISSSKTEISYPMIDTILPEIKNNFPKFIESDFVNPLIFPNIESIMRYWKSYALYDEKIEDKFYQNMIEHFSNNSKFITTKKIIGTIGYL
jgi:ubiquinone/menaquinone biosynthesis C-methylase UbiE